jgi:hypothetical protein
VLQATKKGFFSGFVVCLVYLAFTFLVACNGKRATDFQTKALVLYSNSQRGNLNKKQKVLVAFKDQQGNIEMQKVVLLNFSKSATPGDSLDLIIRKKELIPGNLYLMKHQPNDRFLYTYNNGSEFKKLLFDGGVLMDVVTDAKGNMLSLSFSNYKKEPNNTVRFYDLGNPNEVVGFLEGAIGGDSISFPGAEEFYVKANKGRHW